MTGAFVLLLAVTAKLQAQATDTIARPLEDSVIQRAKQLVADGRVAEGRRVLDSLLRSNPPESELYVDALYWRAALATTAADAERDYRRLLIEAPLSVRAEDALLQLAQLEQARGDRRDASDHLQRFMLSYARHPARPRVAIMLVRLLFEQGPQQAARACETLRSARDEIPPDNAELRNQLEFYAPRCTVAEVAPQSPDSQPTPVTSTPASARREPSRSAASARPSTTRPSTASARPSTPRPSTTRVARAAPAFYSVQVAAYDSPEPATQMARTLVARGIEARVDGKVRPFRVRVGRYTTRAEAVKAAATLKSQGHGGFVVLVSGGRRE